MSSTAGAAGASLERLLEVIGQLRERCPWMGALTHESLAEYLVEECYELLESLEDPARADELRAELGDVLLQVVLHARLQEEQGSFVMADVIEGLTAKMIRRNPHVFTELGALRDRSFASVEEIEAAWHLLKKREQPETATPFTSIPRGLPALAAAAKTIKRARRSGAEQEKSRAAVVPVHEGPVRTEEELGALLLTVVEGAVDAGLDPERALRLAVRRYQSGHLANLPAAASEGSPVTDGN